MDPIKIFTIGFTKKTAREFFERLRDRGVKRVLDIRLNNTSQLAGFTRKDDLKYFLEVILGIEYIHLPILTPTKEILDAFRKTKGDWSHYEPQFIKLIESRKIEKHLDRKVLNGGCLLCSEQRPEQCHRRLVAEYLSQKWGDVAIEHIL